jgi:hypothetical protein
MLPSYPPTCIVHWLVNGRRLQVSERLLGEARLLAKSLTADVERLTREKKDQADRAEAKQVRGERVWVVAAEWLAVLASNCHHAAK